MLVGKLHFSNMQARKKALLPPPRPRTTGEKGMSVCHNWWHGPVENKSSSPCSWEKVWLKSLEIKVCILGCNGMCMCSNWGDARILHLWFVMVHVCSAIEYTWVLVNVVILTSINHFSFFQNSYHRSYCSWPRDICVHRCSLLASWFKSDHQYSPRHP